MVIKKIITSSSFSFSCSWLSRACMLPLFWSLLILFSSPSAPILPSSFCLPPKSLLLSFFPLRFKQNASSSCSARLSAFWILWLHRFCLCAKSTCLYRKGQSFQSTGFRWWFCLSLTCFPASYFHLLVFVISVSQLQFMTSAFLLSAYGLSSGPQSFVCFPWQFFPFQILGFSLFHWFGFSICRFHPFCLRHAWPFLALGSRDQTRNWLWFFLEKRFSSSIIQSA